MLAHIMALCFPPIKLWAGRESGGYLEDMPQRGLSYATEDMAARVPLSVS